jgi:hypothetical protein
VCTPREISTGWRQPAQDLAVPVTSASTGCASGAFESKSDAPVAVLTGTASGAVISQSQFSRMHDRKFPAFVRFSTTNGAPHFGHGSLMGSCGDVKSQSGYLLHP